MANDNHFETIGPEGISRMRNLKYFGIISIILGALVILYVMLGAVSYPENFFDVIISILAILWVLFPLIVLMALIFYFDQKQFSPAHRVASIFITMIVVVTSVIIYAQPLNPTSSTSALIYAVLPVYSHIAIGLLYLIAWFLLRRFKLTKSKRITHNNTPDEKIG